MLLLVKVLFFFICTLKCRACRVISATQLTTLSNATSCITVVMEYSRIQTRYTKQTYFLSAIKNCL